MLTYHSCSFLIFATSPDSAISKATKPFVPFLALETWLTYSMYETDGEGKSASQSDIYLRRLRFGARGNPTESYLIHIAPYYVQFSVMISKYNFALFRIKWFAFK